MRLSDFPPFFRPGSVALVPAVPPVRPPGFALAGCGRPRRKPGPLVSRDPHRLFLRRKWRDLPGSWGDPSNRMPCSRTPVGLLSPGHSSGRVLSPLEETRTTPTTCAFRGSITRPSVSLSTLRRRPYGMSPRKTRFRLVASLCRAGFVPAGSPMRGFRSVDCRLHRFPLSQAYPGALPLSLYPGGYAAFLLWTACSWHCLHCLGVLPGTSGMQEPP